MKLRTHLHRFLLAILLFIAHGALAQQPPGGVQTGEVLDPQQRPIAGAMLSLASSASALVRTDLQGHFTLPIAAPGARVHVAAPGFAEADVTATPGAPLRIVLIPAARSESVVVTAYRTPLAADASPVSTRTLTAEDLRAAPSSPALDDKLRQVPGFELFRRSSSLVANPTAQGVSLRGLGSTAASRTLVISDEVPLNDAFGGWIHWDELPELGIASATVVRGGVSDLYGSSAIGGVVELQPVLPSRNAFELTSSYGSFATNDDSALLTGSRTATQHGTWGALLTGGLLRTGGYTLVTPQFRGAVDRPSDLHAQNGRAELDHTSAGGRRVFLRGNLLNEVRNNGTPLTVNGTRLWRYEAGAEGDTRIGGLALRLYGDTEHFRQTFSSIAPGRAHETLTRYVYVPADELGAALRWSRPVRPDLLLLAGADTRDVRASDHEQAFVGAPSNRFKDITARQRQSGLYGEALWAPHLWTVTLSGRFDHFSNFDAVQLLPGKQAEPALAESVLDPRLGVVRHVSASWSVTGSAFRAYRAPTLNELYRTGQVGQETTLPNAALRSERATGWEGGLLYAPAGVPATLRASYFWTEVNRPVTALTLSITPTAVNKMRENLGQIRSRGVSLDGELHPLPWLTALGGYQYADATVTSFRPQPDLVGKWIPQVAHNTGTLMLRVAAERVGILSLEGRWSGRQYDDDANVFLLHSFFTLNAYAGHTFRGRWTLFATGENLLDRSVDAGRTPVLTLAMPRSVRGGLRFRVGD